VINTAHFFRRASIVRRLLPVPARCGYVDAYFHSDRGVQYACTDFRSLLEQNGFIQSMSGKGDCWDNAVAESFFAILKTEFVYHEHYQGHQDTMHSVFEYIEAFYNR
jgi:putative transposase